VGRFVFKRHLCLVLEAMETDLRRLVLKFGRGKGLRHDMPAVRSYGRQLLTGVAHVHAVGLVHADLKPDNVVLDRSLLRLKVRGACHGVRW
jgi:serine/threonine-protein kinase PRP4